MKKFLLFFTFVLLIISSTAWSMDEHENQEKGKLPSRLSQFASELRDKHISELETCETGLQTCNNELSKLKKQPPCPNPVNSTCETDLNACNTAKGICNEELIKLKEQLLCPKPTLQSEMLQLVTSSFLKGAAYSILPEIVRNVLESRRYYGLSKIAPTLIEAGLIVYNTESYIPIFTCFAVRRGFRSLGFSEETSTTAASTAAVLANVVPSLIFSQETSINYMLNCSLAILASYAGSTLALTAKSCYNAYYDDWWSQILAGRCYLQIQEGSDQIQRNRALGSNPLFNVKEKDPLVKWSQIIRILTRLSMEKGETK